MAEQVAADLLIRLDATTEALRRELKRADKSVGDFDTRVGRSLKTIDERFAAMNRTIGRSISTMQALAGALAVRELVQFGQRALGAAENIADVARQADISAKALQTLRFAFDQNGGSAQQMDQALVRFQQRLGQARAGAGEAAKAVQQLGVNISRARPSEDIFRDVVDGIAALETQADRAAVASRFFGEEAGAKLAPLLSQGSRAIDAYGRDLQSLGALIDDEIVAKSAEASARLRALQNAFATSLQAGFLTEVVNEFGTVENSMRRATELADDFGRVAGQAFVAISQAAAVLADNMDLVAAAAGAIAGARIGAIFGPLGGLIGAAAGAMLAYSQSAEDATTTSADLEAAQRRLADLQKRLAEATGGASDATEILAGESTKATRALALETKAAEAAAEALRALADIRRLGEQTGTASQSLARVQEILNSGSVAPNTPAYDTLIRQGEQLADTVAQSDEKFREFQATLASAREDAAKFEAEAEKLRKTLGNDGGGGGGGGVAGGAREAAESLNRVGLTVDDVAAALAPLIDRYAQADAELARLNAEVQAFLDAPLQDALADTSEAFTDLFRDAFSGTLNSFDDFTRQFQSILANFAARVVQQQIIIPILADVGMGLGLSQGATADALGVPPQMLGGGGFGGGLPSLLDIGSLFSASGNLGTNLAFSSFGTSQAGQALGLSTQLTLPNGALVGSPVPTPNGITGSALNGISSAGSLAAGFAANMAADLVFGGNRSPAQQRNASIGAAAGGVAANFGGAAIAPLLGATFGPFGAAIATLIGTFAGNALGGLFGPGVQSDLTRFQIDRATGEGVQIDPDGEFTQQTLDRATAFAEQASTVIASLEEVLGATLDNIEMVTGVSAGQREPDQIELRGAGNEFLGLDFQIEAGEDIAAGVLQAFLDSVDDLAPEFRAALEGLIEAPSVPARGRGALGDSPLRMVPEIDPADFETVIRGIGIARAIAAEVEALEAIDSAPVSALGEAYAALNERLDEQAAALRDAGLPLDDLERLREIRSDELLDGFLASLDDARAALAGETLFDPLVEQVRAAEAAFRDADFVESIRGEVGADEMVAENLRMSLSGILDGMSFPQLTEFRDRLAEAAEQAAAAGEGTEAFAVALAETDAAIAGFLDSEAVTGIRNRFEDIFGEQGLAGDLAQAGIASGSAVAEVLREVEGLAEPLAAGSLEAAEYGERILLAASNGQELTGALGLLDQMLVRTAAATEEAAQELEYYTVEVQGLTSRQRAQIETAFESLFGEASIGDRAFAANLSQPFREFFAEIEAELAEGVPQFSERAAELGAALLALGADSEEAATAARILADELVPAVDEFEEVVTEAGDAAEAAAEQVREYVDQTLALTVGLEEALGGLTDATQLEALGLRQGAPGFDALAGFLASASLSAADLTDATRLLIREQRGLEDAGVDVLAVQGALVSAYQDQQAAAAAAVEQQQALIAAEQALTAARRDALESLDLELTRRLEGDGAARELQLVQAGLVGLVDELREIGAAGTMAEAEEAIRRFISEARGLSDPNLMTLAGGVGFAAFDDVSRRLEAVARENERIADLERENARLQEEAAMLQIEAAQLQEMVASNVLGRLEGLERVQGAANRIVADFLRRQGGDAASAASVTQLFDDAGPFRRPTETREQRETLIEQGLPQRLTDGAGVEADAALVGYLTDALEAGVDLFGSRGVIGQMVSSPASRPGFVEQVQRARMSAYDTAAGLGFAGTALDLGEMAVSALRTAFPDLAGLTVGGLTTLSGEDQDLLRLRIRDARAGRAPEQDAMALDGATFLNSLFSAADIDATGIFAELSQQFAEQFERFGIGSLSDMFTGVNEESADFISNLRDNNSTYFAALDAEFGRRNVDKLLSLPNIVERLGDGDLGERDRELLFGNLRNTRREIGGLESIDEAVTRGLGDMLAEQFGDGIGAAGLELVQALVEAGDFFRLGARLPDQERLVEEDLAGPRNPADNNSILTQIGDVVFAEGQAPENAVTLGDLYNEALADPLVQGLIDQLVTGPFGIDQIEPGDLDAFDGFTQNVINNFDEIVAAGVDPVDLLDLAAERLNGVGDAAGGLIDALSELDKLQLRVDFQDIFGPATIQQQLEAAGIADAFGDVFAGIPDQLNTGSEMGRAAIRALGDAILAVGAPAAQTATALRILQGTMSDLTAAAQQEARGEVSSALQALRQATTAELASLAADRDRRLAQIAAERSDAQAAYATMRDQLAESREAIEAAWADEKLLLDEDIAAARDLASELSSVFGVIERGVEQLRVNSREFELTRQDLGLAQLDRMVRQARAGEIPSADRVSAALANIGTIGPERFGTREDFLRTAIQAQQDARALRNIVGEQKTTAELQLEAAQQALEDAQLANRQQLDALEQQQRAAEEQHGAHMERLDRQQEVANSQFSAQQEALQAQLEELEHQARLATGEIEATVAVEAAVDRVRAAIEALVGLETSAAFGGVGGAGGTNIPQGQYTLAALIATGAAEAAEAQFQRLLDEGAAPSTLADASRAFVAQFGRVPLAEVPEGFPGYSTGVVNFDNLEDFFRSGSGGSGGSSGGGSRGGSSGGSGGGTSGEEYATAVRLREAFLAGETGADLGRTFTQFTIDYGYNPLDGLPGYADGGVHPGGLRLVGERGPELELTGPSRIYSAEETARILSPDAALVDEVRELRREVRQLRAANSRENQAQLDVSRDTQRRIKDFDLRGLPAERA